MIKENGRSLSGLFVFSLLGLFALFAVLLSLLGAQVYQNTVAVSDAHAEERILLSFVRSTVRNADVQSRITVEECGGVQTLTLETLEDEETYLTRLYCRDGMLKEWFAEKQMPFAPEDGEDICPCEVFDPKLGENMLSVRLAGSDGQEKNVYLALHRSGSGED